MMDKRHCVGCKDNFYNCGDRECWSLKNARLITRYRIHMDAPMGKRSNFTKVTVPNCFYGGGYSGDQYALVNSIPDTAA